jgi:hypothetical protein
MSFANATTRWCFTSLKRRITQSARQSSQIPTWKRIGAPSSGQPTVAFPPTRREQADWVASTRSMRELRLGRCAVARAVLRASPIVGHQQLLKAGLGRSSIKPDGFRYPLDAT